MQNDVEKFLQLRQGRNFLIPCQVSDKANSCELFNFVMESVLRKARVHRNGIIFQKSVQLLAYADNIDIIGCSKPDVTAAFSGIEW